jgi:hypothetical protein
LVFDARAAVSISMSGVGEGVPLKLERKWSDCFICLLWFADYSDEKDSRTSPTLRQLAGAGFNLFLLGVPNNWIELLQKSH